MTVERGPISRFIEKNYLHFNSAALAPVTQFKGVIIRFCQFHLDADK